MRVLVTSSRSPHALALIRGLGARDWEVTAADNTRLSPGMHSRFVKRRLVTPNMTESPRAWLNALLRELSAVSYNLLLPTFEEVFLIARYRRALPLRIRLFVEDHDKLVRLHHKPELTRLAASLGIAVPQTWQPEDAEALRGVADDLPYPVVIKPPAANSSLGLTSADEPVGLYHVWRRLIRRFGAAAGGMPLIQRQIPGRQVSTLAFGLRGAVLGQMTYEPLLMFPDGGGTAFVRQTIRDEPAEAIATQLIGALDWTGFVGFDFIVDDQTGRPTLIDGNPRPTPALVLARHAGVDFAEILDEVVRERPQRLRFARPGVCSRTLFLQLIWAAFMLLPGRGWVQRVTRVIASFKKRALAPDLHDPSDRRPSWALALYMPYVMLVIDALKGRRGGYMYGCNFDSGTAEASRDLEPARS